MGLTGFRTVKAIGKGAFGEVRVVQKVDAGEDSRDNGEEGGSLRQTRFVRYTLSSLYTLCDVLILLSIQPSFVISSFTSAPSVVSSPNPTVRRSCSYAARSRTLRTCTSS